MLSYSFTLIAEASDRSSFRVVNNGTINQEGRVAYLATLHAEGQVILTSDGTRSRIIAVTNDLWESSTSNTPINAQGMVSIRGNMRGGGQVALRGDGGPLTRIADTTPKSPLSELVLGTDLSGDGTVVFTANFRDDGRQAILLGDGGAPAERTNNLGPWAAIQVVPNINGNGLVAFRATLDEGGDGIFVNEGGTDHFRIRTNELYRDFAGGVPINDAGVVVTVANLWEEGQHFLMMRDGQEPEILATTGEVFGAFGGRCLDNSDRVVFRATLVAGGAGVFAGFDPEKDRVLVIGDELFGSTVTDVLFAGSNGCNDSGQLTLRAVLNDGRTVLVRADPTRGGGRAPGGSVGGGLQAGPDIVSLLTADPAGRQHVLAGIAAAPIGVANEIALVIPGGTEAAAWLRPTAPVLPDSPKSELVDVLFDDFAAAAWLR